MPAEIRYPVYIPSRGRYAFLHTANCFDKGGVPFRVVVEPQEAEKYAATVGAERVLTLPDNNRGLVFSRNWILEHAIAEGHKRHWQFDDDITALTRVYKGKKIPCSANVALSALEDFVDRYENVALASFNSEFFVPLTGQFAKDWPPFYLNARCYTVFLMLCSLPNRFRGLNEDTDITLQVLSDGWCTVLLNAFMIRTKATLTAKGGQTDSGYRSDGLLRRARYTERMWPGVCTVKRKFRRPQHHIKGLWKKFDTQLVRRKDVDFDALPSVDERGMKLRAVREVKSADLRAMLEGE